jgi:hypothetical protein
MSQRSRERILELAMPLNAEKVLDVLREAIVPPSG